jgi:hypothetical protein
MIVSEIQAIEKKPGDVLRSQNSKSNLIVVHSPTLKATNMPLILVFVDLIGRDSIYIPKKLGDIPIAKPGTRD